MTRSAPWFLLVVCLAGMFLARESRRPGLVAGIDRAFFDWLSANAPLPPRSSNGIHSTVTLVEIDDSIADDPGRLPLSPLEYASFLQAAGKYDPAVVAIEPVLEWTKLPAGTEEILANQALILPKLLLAVELGSNPENPRDPASLPAVGRLSGNPAGLPEFPEIVAAPSARLLGLAAAAGAINLPGLKGAPVRDLPLLFRCRDRVLPSFALQTLMLWLRLAPSEVSVKLGAYVQLGDALRLPINHRGRALLDAREFGSVNRLNLDDLSLLGTNQAPPGTRAIAEQMRGGIIILGRTDRAGLHPQAGGRPRSLAGGSFRVVGGQSGARALDPASRTRVGRGDHRGVGAGGLAAAADSTPLRRGDHFSCARGVRLDRNLLLSDGSAVAPGGFAAGNGIGCRRAALGHAGGSTGEIPVVAPQPRGEEP